MILYTQHIKDAKSVLYYVTDGRLFNTIEIAGGFHLKERLPAWELEWSPRGDCFKKKTIAINEESGFLFITIQTTFYDPASGLIRVYMYNFQNELLHPAIIEMLE